MEITPISSNKSPSKMLVTPRFERYISIVEIFDASPSNLFSTFQRRFFHEQT